jgi:hypothetical protein
MTDPTRLLDEGATDAELAILRAGAAEEPPERGRQKLAVLLGMSAGLSASATAAGSKAAALSSVKVLGAHIGAKWLVLVSVGALAGASAIVYQKRSSRPAPTPSNAIAASRPEALVERAVEPEPQPPGTDAPSVSAPVVRQSGSGKATPGGAAEPSGRSGAKSIGLEIEKLDGVRRALRANTPAEALRLLEVYDREHAGGVLAQEAVLLRIEALSASGNTAAARSVAERFLKDNPKTPHRRRISTLVGLP